MKTNIKICNLRINHFATIESQEIQFKEGFNAIVGETGSGKSLILNAFNILLGNKADKKYIRKGCDFYTVEGTFTSKDPIIKKFLRVKIYLLKMNSLLNVLFIVVVVQSLL